MSELVFGKDVEVVAGKHDRYGRTIGKVLVADPSCRTTTCPKTVDAGYELITMGLAWWYRKYAREQSGNDAQRYEQAEQDAQARRVGLWGDPQPTPPWEWRHPSRP